MMHRLACALLIAVAGCSEAPPPSADLLAKGRAVYNFRCYFCHGYSGNAKTLAGTYMTPAPRDFTAATPADLTVEKIAVAVRHGKPGTGMKGFAGVIGDNEIKAVSAFVFDEFVQRKATNTRYHTEENGWPNHDRYQAAYPFALGEIPLTAQWESLTPTQQRGRVLFLGTCVSCHDRGKPATDSVVWESRALSYPRNNYDHKQPTVDAATSATPYRLHDVQPALKRPTALEKTGQKLFQENCAFCHAADGTGKNWIGAFLEPHPRNLTAAEFMSGMNRPRLRTVIREGLPGTSMPAWKAVLSEPEIDAVIAYINKAFYPLPD
jgi:cytochrome c oxidase cbb3-type subunit III